MKRLLKSECGASAGEYALILGIIGSAVAIAVVLLGQSISTGFSSIGDLQASAAEDTARGSNAGGAPGRGGPPADPGSNGNGGAASGGRGGGGG